MTTNTDVAMPDLPPLPELPLLRNGLKQIRDITLPELHAYATAYARAAIQQAAGAVPEGWMRDEKQVRELMCHLVNTGWAQTERGPDCVDQGSAMAAEVIERVLLPMLAASPSPPKQQPVHLVGGEVGGVPLTDEYFEQVVEAMRQEDWAHWDCQMTREHYAALARTTFMVLDRLRSQTGVPETAVEQLKEPSNDIR